MPFLPIPAPQPLMLLFNYSCPHFDFSFGDIIYLLLIEVVKIQYFSPMLATHYTPTAPTLP